MPLILNGSSLLQNTSGGLATTTSCCCGQNPERCFCPDFCGYQIEIVSPEEGNIGKQPQLPCAQGAFVGEQFLQDCCDCGATFGSQFYVPSPNCSKQTYTMPGDAFFLKQYAGTFSPDGPVLLWSAVARVILECVGVDFPIAGAPAKLMLRILWSGSVNYIGYGVRNVSRMAVVEAPQECVIVRGALRCGGGEAARTAVISTPLEFTVTYLSPGVGSWPDSDQVNQTSDDQTTIGPCFDSCVKDFAVTFRITRRQSCRIVDCNCSTSLDGLKATFEGKEFTLGTEEPYNEFFSGYELVTTHYKDFSGNYVFEKYKVLEFPAGTIGDVQLATVYCETDDEADPPVPRWYVRFESICRQFAPDAETKRTEIGYLPCSESAGCAGRTEGDPLPLGSPIDVEEIEGSPETTDGLDACTPPARADLTIFEDCG